LVAAAQLYSTFILPSNEHIFIALSRYRSIKSLNQFDAQAAKLEQFSPECPNIYVFAKIINTSSFSRKFFEKIS
jgi:hypothetical protein